MVGDTGRAEDVVQETFASALRSLRASERPIAFKPWVYQITRNACIDQLRRSSRAEEISIDCGDLAPGLESRLSQHVPRTESAASQRLAINDLWQAFGGLSESQHEILVLRELEGLSYDEISRRMNLTTSSVRSMLFTARRGLREEYDAIATGDRCRRVQTVMSEVAEGLGGRRDRRMAFRHIRHCTVCRHEALALGIDRAALEQPGRVRSAASKAAAWLPLPFFLRRRSDPSPELTAGESTAHASGTLTQLGVNLGTVGAEHATSMVQKAVAVVAAVAVVGGGGFVAHRSGVSLPLIGGAHAKEPHATTSNTSFQSDGSGAATGVPASLGPGSDGLVPSSDQSSSSTPFGGAVPPGSAPVGPDGSPAGPAGPGAGTPETVTVPGDPVTEPLPTGSLPVSAPAPKPGKRQSQPSSGGGEEPSASDPSYRIPPGIERAPGLDGRIPNGIQKKLDDPAAAETTPKHEKKPKSADEPVPATTAG